MPWRIQRRDGKHCVVKSDTGETVKCHDSRVKAIKHQRALYANEPSMSASILSEVEEPEVIVAAVSPLKPPRSWFEVPEANVPTPLTFTSEGQVHGHLALWNSCHTGFLNGAFSECVKAPRSQTEYQLFHVGEIETEEGDLVPIGKLTFDTNHAPLTAGLQAASRHYDETGSVGAFVRARDGQHGVWLSGAVRSDLSPEGLRDLRANPPSGDWRALNHNLELIASLAVPVPGFPIPRAQLALAASANGEQEVSALILPGVTEPEPDRGMIRHKAVLRTRTREALAAAVLTAKERRSLPRKR